MSKLTFFHQKRNDSAFRTGIEVDGELVLERFVPGDLETDTALVWYVDVRCAPAESLRPEASSARAFLERSDIQNPIKAALLTFAEDLVVGLDSDIWPGRRGIQGLPPDCAGEIVCSAMRRVTDGELSEALASLANRWGQTLAELSEARELV